jgi:hypothetical protein
VWDRLADFDLPGKADLLMMITVTNYSSGELLIADGSGQSIRLGREEANRLVMMARMHTVAEFVEKLPTLLGDAILAGAILQGFDKKSSTDRWNLKEKFARLHTLSKDYRSERADGVIEVVSLGQ